MEELMRTLLFLPPQASTMARQVDHLHYFVIVVTMISSFGVYIAAFWFNARNRRRGHDQLTAHVYASGRSEATMIIGFLALFLVWWLIGYRQFVQMAQAPADAMVVYVTAKQWMWKFAYANGRSANDVLTVPVGQPVKLAMTSRDVIHSFYVPGFRLKQDVLPGRYTTLWFEATAPGVYPIFCAEYCGVAHSRMRGEVVVLSAEDYAVWLRDDGRDGSGVGVANSERLRDGANQTGPSQLVTLGAQIAERRECVACHTINGQTHIGPTFSRLYGSWVTLADGRRVLAGEAYLTRSMMEPMSDVVAGYKSVMPTYQGLLPEPEVAALVEFIRSLRDGPVPAGVTLPRLTVSSQADAGDARAPEEEKK